MKLPGNIQAKVSHWDDERELGNSLIVTLIDGYKFSEDKFLVEHVRGFDTKKDAIASIRRAVPCRCETCKLVTP